MKLSLKEFESLPEIGEGDEAIVKRKGSLALKYFCKSPFTLSKKSSLEAQYGLESEFIRFPQGKLCVGNKYNGCYFPFVEGVDLRNYFLYDLIPLLKWAEDIERSTKILAENGLVICDLHLGNAVIDENKMTIIDTTKYILIQDKEEAYFRNILELNRFFINFLYFNKIDIRGAIRDKFLPDDLCEKFYNLNFIEQGKSFSLFLYQLLDELKVSNVGQYQQKVFTLK